MTTRDAAVHGVHHPMFARMWAWMAPGMERHGAARHRDRMLLGICGRVIEVGAGTGANFPHYPPEVTGVLAVEPEAHLRTLADTAAEQARVEVGVVPGTAEALPAADAAFDAAVTSLVLCTVSDQERALAELRRVLRPGGRLHFWEHVRADGGVLAPVQTAVDRFLWPALGGGCHTARDTAAAIADGGFRLERLERFRFPDSGLPMPTAPQILGVAVRT